MISIVDRMNALLDKYSNSTKKSMTQPRKKDFGWTRLQHWNAPAADQDAYLEAVKAYENRPRNQPGKAANNQPHESWNDVLRLFNPSDPTRSQGAFCRWAEINPATFSGWKRKPLRPDVEKWIKEWEYVGDGLGLDGSFNTMQYVEK
jgi:hypothetical protein